MIKPTNNWPYRYKIYGDLGGEEMYNLDALRNRTLYYPSPRNFNDPFDCAPSAPVLSMELCRELAERKLKSEPRLNVKQHPELSRSQIIEYMANDIQRSNDGGETRDWFYSGYGILCLTRDPTSILMWSHYGKNHSGFALEFDYRYAVSFNSDSSHHYPSEYKLITVPVTYTNTRPPFKALKESSSPFDGFLEKASCWEYEKEERVIVENGDRSIAFDPTLISAILVGAKCSEETLDKIYCAVDSHIQNTSKVIPIYKVALDNVSYRLTVLGHPYFGKSEYKDVN